MDTLALSEQMVYSSQAPVSFTLAFTPEASYASSISSEKETIEKGQNKLDHAPSHGSQRSTCWVCDHATCCVFLCFTLQHRITLLFFPTTGASGESKQTKHVFHISYYQIFSEKLINGNYTQKSAFYFCHKTLSSFFEKLMSALSLNGLLFWSLLGDSKAYS